MKLMFLACFLLTFIVIIEEYAIFIIKIAIIIWKLRKILLKLGSQGYLIISMEPNQVKYIMNVSKKSQPNNK
jgi:hypothetical protein